MKTILAVAAVLLASCASAPKTSPVKVVVDAQAPMRGVDVDNMADVAKHYFAKYSGPPRTVSIMLSGTLVNDRGIESVDRVYPGDILPKVSYQILDASGGVLESGYVPIVQKLEFNREPLALYHEGGRFIADRLQRLDRGPEKITVVAHSPVSQSEADDFRKVALDGIRNTGSLQIDVSLDSAPTSGSPRPSFVTAAPGANFAPSSLGRFPNSSPFMGGDGALFVPGNPITPYAGPSGTSPINEMSNGVRDDIYVTYLIRDASGNALDEGSEAIRFVNADRAWSYQPIVERLAKRVAKLQAR